MAFKKATTHGYAKRREITDSSTEEILDYLTRTKSILNDLNIKTLNRKFEQSLLERLSGIFKSVIGLKTNTRPIILLGAISFCFLIQTVKVNAVPSKALFSDSIAGLQAIEKTDVKVLSPLNLKTTTDNKSSLVTVSEETKDNLSGVKPGNSLMLVPGTLKVHKVKPGENLLKIANKYGVTPRALANANLKINVLKLKPGVKVVIPDKKAVKRDHRYHLASRGFAPSIGFSSFDRFLWPTSGTRVISSKFGFRWARKHLGVDIQGKYGTPILAAKSGVVEFSGWDGEYGKSVLIDHGNNIKTFYSHASKLIVRAGDIIDVGQIIGKIGTTGRATGPHLHFEVRVNGAQRDPQKYL